MTQSRRVVVMDTPDDLAYQAAVEFEVRSRAAIEDHKRFTVALSGGSTPRALYALLTSPQFAEDIDWSRIHFFWGDERCVPPDDPVSNFGEAKKLLLDPLQIAPENIHHMRGELEPHRGSLDYSDQLTAFFGADIVFDLIYLGLGEDGHTASLFPNCGALDVVDEPCVAVHQPTNPIARWRLTLTYPVINAARAAMFLVDGAGKAEVLGRILEGPHDARRLPAQGVSPENGSLVWLVDKAAAVNLKSRV